MEQQYKQYIAKLFAVLICFCIITAGYILFAVIYTVNRSDTILRELMMENAEEEMERVVNNVIISIETKREKVRDEMTALAGMIAEHAELMDDSPEVLKEQTEHLASMRSDTALQVLIEETGNDQAILIADDRIQNVSLAEDEFRTRMENSPVYLQREDENRLYHVFAEQDDIDTIVKVQIHEELHRTIYGDEKYVWVNEVVNFDGGDNYAIRVIHPNLKDTEGMYLSTTIMDASGGTPYQAELEGIKKDGEVTHQYFFKKFQSDEIARKMSYAKLYEPYQWIIATGEPLEDILRVSHKTGLGSREVALFLASISIISEVLLLGALMRMQNKFRNHIDSYVKAETELDMMTGALSRKAGQMEVDRLFQQYQAHGTNCMMVMLDVDLFKTINDTHGHDVGDEVLCQVVQALKTHIRESDRLIRWGGDEFLVLCIGVEPEAQPKVAEKLLNSVRDLRIRTPEGEISVTLSMGYSVFEPQDEGTKAILIRADEALYYSKEHGRNQFTGYEQIKKE